MLARNSSSSHMNFQTLLRLELGMWADTSWCHHQDTVIVSTKVGIEPLNVVH